MRKVFILLSITFFLAGCKAAEQREGIVLQVNKASLLVAQNINEEKYQEIKDLPSEDWTSYEGLGLITLSYKSTDKFKPGDKVVFWLEGPVAESYPEQAEARKIEIK